MTRNSGLLLLDKPSGMTSHDVVARVRRILDLRRVGHAGTLDPMATGLLVMAVGPSTRLLRFAQAEVKRYCGEVKLGVATDSLDADGVVTVVQAVPVLSTEMVNAAAQSMIGPQLQTPPMVSAIKVGGRRLHELAREGVEVEREPRQVTISEFTIAPTNDPTVWVFEVECTVGTYVRVLLSDLAGSIGTVGHLTALRRLSSGSHSVEDAMTLESLTERVERGENPLEPSSHFVVGLERVTLGGPEQAQMRMGQQLVLDDSFAGPEIAALDASGSLLGILKRRGVKWQPELVLPPSPDPAHG
jgi:tRNA pseudouridine55 synthase